jgi:hypothetical protein
MPLKWMYVVMQGYIDRTVFAKTWLADKLHNKKYWNFDVCRVVNLEYLKSFSWGSRARSSGCT